MKYQYHELANLFPLLDGKAFEDLVNDIIKHGLLSPVVLFEDQILDGRNRYRACLEACVEPVFEQYDGDDPLGYVVSHNLHRRHLTTSQRDMVAASLATMKHGGDRSKAQICALKTQDEVAKMLNVSRRGVQQARKVLDSGDKDIIEKVRNGEMSVSKAEKQIKEKSKTQPEEIEDYQPYQLSELQKSEQHQLYAKFNRRIDKHMKNLQIISLGRSCEDLEAERKSAIKTLNTYANAIGKIFKEINDAIEAAGDEDEND